MDLKEIELQIANIKQTIETRSDLTIEEIVGYENELKELETKANTAKEVEEHRSALLQRIANGAGQTISTFTPQGNAQVTETDTYGTAEYRSAFRNYVTKGIPIGAEFRSNETTLTSDAGAVIPTTIANKVIEKLETVGEIYKLVTKSNVKAGLSIPVDTLKPTAMWVGENKSTDTQKKTPGSITFGAYKLRCAVAQSLEVSVMSLDVFEDLIVKNITTAMMRAIEAGIIGGSGTNAPKGILNYTFLDTQKVAVSEINLEVIKEVEKKIPLEHEDDAVWVVSKSLFTELKFITDDNGRPIAIEDLNQRGISRRTIFNRPALLTNQITNYDVAAVDETIGFVGDLADYVFNTNFEMTFKEYEDNETEAIVKKAIMLGDGKLARTDSFVILEKAEASE